MDKKKFLRIFRKVCPARGPKFVVPFLIFSETGGVYKSGAPHLRATVHDRSALELKKIIVNGEDLVVYQEPEDLATKLSLRRSPLLFVDYWMMSKVRILKI